MGFYGAAWSDVMAYYVQLLLLLLTLLIPDVLDKRTWPGFSNEAFCGWQAYLAIALPGLFMMSLEWWSWEVLSLFAGLGGSTALAAHGILATMASLNR